MFIRATKGVYVFFRNAAVLLLVLMLGIFIGAHYRVGKAGVYQRAMSPAELIAAGSVKYQIPFVKGEQLIYSVRANGMTVGRSTLTYRGEVELEGKPVHYVTFQTVAMGVDDTEHIYAQLNTFLPVKVRRDIVKLGKKQVLTEKYDQAKGRVEIFDADMPEKPVQVYEKGLPYSNPILLTYYFRAKETGFTEGKIYPVVLPKLQFDLKFVGDQDVTTANGTFKAFYFSSKPDQFKFWLGQGVDRVPLKIEQTGFMGYSLILESAQNT
jgi:hypothetical protein